MTFPTISDPILDDCLGKHVRVEYLEPAGVRHHYGILQDYSKPWSLNLMFEYKTDDGLTAAAAVARKSEFAFAGEEGAILRVVCEGELVYENTQLHTKYPSLNCNLEDDLAVLNDIRREIWGDLYLFR